MTFSSKLQKLRKDNNLSQEQLASELCVSRQAISKWELGTLPDINNLVKVSNFFNCSLDYLMNDDNRNEHNADKERPFSCPINAASSRHASFCPKKRTHSSNQASNIVVISSSPSSNTITAYIQL